MRRNVCGGCCCCCRCFVVLFVGTKKHTNRASPPPPPFLPPPDMQAPTPERFVYNRCHPPLFFAAPTAAEECEWVASMTRVTREYFKMSRLYNMNVDALLSNGMTYGEYAMWLIIESHQKRVHP